MIRRPGVIAETALTTAALVLGAAPSASADPFCSVRSHHASHAECDAAGRAGRHLWGSLYPSKPFAGEPWVWKLWVRW